MSRPTFLEINTTALLHNLQCIRASAPGKKIMAMVKANAYGCGIDAVIPVLEGKVDYFGVACLEEALAIRALGSLTPCVLLEGVFEAEEWLIASQHHFQCVIHQIQQLHWLLNNPCSHKMTVWIKVNTGMYRLGFPPEAVHDVIQALMTCPWIDPDIGLLTHFASADCPHRLKIRHKWMCSTRYAFLLMFL